MNITIIDFIICVVVAFLLFGLSQILEALLNLITNIIDYATVKIIVKSKKLQTQQQQEEEYQNTNVIGFQIDSSTEEDEDYDTHKK